MLLRLEDLKVYQLAMEIGSDIWLLVEDWSTFAKDTLGKQITRSADSIALNIAEGYGRYHFKENKNFCYIARGSNMETKSAVIKAKSRNLISENDFNRLFEKLELLHKLLNAYIKSIGKVQVNDN
jgi:four helix bundle protein